ncbi:putative heat-shock protein hsp70 [Trypanosoma cruzi]|uniref:Putative heat-shock protein hsp70 n=1 Tax=Trypanosoma cruzi TaxID=5693 RepID=A0A2V2VPG8_TRYCR|nr:putative heat-shock protein hsp70 [Trypanosoma cruzi]
MRSRCSLSCASYLAASDTMRSMSALLRRPLSFVMTIWLRLPVPFSSADTFRMPLASRSKVTSIWGTPRGAGGMPDRSNVPSRWQSFVIARSPSKTWMCTPGWLSAYVEKIWLFLVGIVVLRLISDVMTPPAVSMPSVSGVTSSSSRPSVCLLLPPVRMKACTAAPYATASSGLMLLFSSLPPKKSDTSCITFGMRVEPPTSTTSCTARLSILASWSTRSTGCSVPRKRSPQSSSKRARVMVAWKSTLSNSASISIVACAADDRCAWRARRRCGGGGGRAGCRQVLALVLALELVREVRHEAVVKVLAAQVRVAVRRLHLKDATVDRQQRDIKRAAAKVKYEHIALLAVLHFVQAVRNGGSCRLIDDAQHLHPRDRAGILRRLSLGVVEVRGHRHHGLLHLLAQVRLRNLLHL